MTPGLLDGYRTALASAEARAAQRAADPLPFRVDGPRSRALVTEALGVGDRGVSRYRRALAEFQSERKLWDQAAREWELVIADAPLDAGAHHGRATALAMTGRQAEALEEYRRAVALDGRSVVFRTALARGLWESEQYYQAINEWRAVLTQEPGNLEARLALANAYLRTGDRALALLEFGRVLQLAPGNSEAHRGLAQLGRARGG